MKDSATKTYLFTATALLILLAVTIGMAYVNLGPFNTIAAVNWGNVVGISRPG